MPITLKDYKEPAKEEQTGENMTLPHIRYVVGTLDRHFRWFDNGHRVQRMRQHLDDARCHVDWGVVVVIAGCQRIVSEH